MAADYRMQRFRIQLSTQFNYCEAIHSPLIVHNAHKHVQHNGVKETLTEFRKRYWIVKGQSLTRAIVHQCTTCRKYEGAPFHSPPPSPLPELRIKEDPAFTYTGVDFAGPLFVCSEASRGGSKVWICVFTRLVTRAIHFGYCSQSIHRDLLHTVFEAICSKTWSTTQVSL